MAETHLSKPENPIGSALLGAFDDITSVQMRGMVIASMLLAVVVLGSAVWAILTLAVPLIPLSLVAGNALALGLVQALSGFGSILVAILLWLPISSLIAGLFIDAGADHVDQRAFPSAPKGKPPALLRALPVSLGFAAKALAVNLLALPLAFVPILNVAGFVVLNGCLMGREYFTIAAMRITDDQTVAALRQKHGLAILLAGLALAGTFVVPVLNLATPLFGIALMVRLSRQLLAA
jgi:CysZ protein